MSALLELAERCEQATGPDRELDVLLDEAIGFTVEMPTTPTKRANWPQRTIGLTTPRYTASLDAAMTLVPEGWGRHVGNCGEKSCPYACVTRPAEPFTDFTADAATEALALCAAALRAKAAAQ